MASADKPPKRAKATDPEGGELVRDVNDLLGLIVAYVKQETVVPIKALLRFVAFGVIGAFLLSVGGGLLTLAAVRAVQAETGNHLRGNLTWVPYAGGIVVAGVGAAVAASRIGKGRG